MSARGTGLLRALLAGRAAAAPSSQQQGCGLLQAQAQLHSCASSSRAVTAISSSSSSSTQWEGWEGPSTSGRGLPASQGSRGLRHGLSTGGTRGLSTKKANEESQWLSQSA